MPLLIKVATNPPLRLNTLMKTGSWFSSGTENEMDVVGLNGFGCTLSSENSNGNWPVPFPDDKTSLMVTVPSGFT